MSKPVSISNQVGTNRNTVLHIPSPKKNLTVVSSTAVIPPASVPTQKPSLLVQPLLPSTTLDDVRKTAIVASARGPMKSATNLVNSKSFKLPEDKLLHIIHGETKHFEGELDKLIKSFMTMNFKVCT